MAYLSVQDIVIMLIGIVSLTAWLVIYFSGLKYSGIFESLDEKEFRLKEIYFMGYFVLEKSKFDYRSKKNREMRKLLAVLYGEKYSDFYLRAVRSQQVTVAMLFFVLAFAMYGFSGEISILVIMIVLGVLLAYYFGNNPKKMIDQRSDELMGEFSEVVSKLALLTDSGMILREAWEEVAYSEQGTIYTEMVTAVNDMNNGVSEVEAIRQFGNRCMLPEIKKFNSTLIQGLTQGNRELSVMLKRQSDEVWELKRQMVKRKGEEAQSKLLLPMILMFVGIMVMIMIPIFSNLGM